MQKIDLDFDRNLTPKLKADILVYLESRPLGEAYVLFQSIVLQLQKEPNGQLDRRLNANSPRSGDASLGSDSIPAVATE